MMDKMDRLARVKKLLNLSRNAGASEHEAATALEMAQRIMAEHGISADDLAASEAAEAFVKSGAAVRVAAWESWLAAGLAEAFGCDVLHHGRRGGQWSFIGTGGGPEIAAYAFHVLRRQCLQARAAYIAEHMRRVTVRANKVRRADMYCEGWVSTAMAKALPVRQSTEAQQAIKALTAQKYGALEKLKPVDRNEGRKLKAHEIMDHLRGRSAGKEIDFRQGVGTGGAASPQLIGG